LICSSLRLPQVIADRPKRLNCLAGKRQCCNSKAARCDYLNDHCSMVAVLGEY
jgi:hypothetical protein